MKNKILLSLIVLATILAACGGQQEFVCPDGTVVDSPEKCQPAQEETEAGGEEASDAPAPEEKEADEPSNVEKIAQSAEAQRLVEVAEEKVESFSFVYVGPPDNLPTDKFYVRGNNILVELHKKTDFKLSQPFSHVFINTERGSAMAYCLAEDRVWCPDGEEKYGRVDPDEYMVRTPYQWLTSLKTAEVLGGGPQWESRSTDRVKFTTKNGQSGEMFIVSFYGLPAKVKLDNGDVIEFRDLSINSVPADKVERPQI